MSLYASDSIDNCERSINSSIYDRFDIYDKFLRVNRSTFLYPW